HNTSHIIRQDAVMSKLLPDGWPEIEIPNDAIANDAGQFRDAANLLFRHLPNVPCVLPLLASAAFAVELYLKSLNSKQVYHEEGYGAYRVTAKPMRTGHLLTDLYKALDGEIKRSIQKSYSSQKRRFASVNTALETYSSVFVASRYPFEDGNEHFRGSIDGL